MSYSKLAYEIAKQAHAGQKDKAGVDYIHHPEIVAGMMETDVEKAVAYLHDVVEDTYITLEQLEGIGFPDEIVCAVEAITKREGEKYNEYLQRIAKNKIAYNVKLADMKHNSDVTRFRSPGTCEFKRAKDYLTKIETLMRIYKHS